MKKFSPIHLSTQFIAVIIILALFLSFIVSFLIKTVETNRLSENLRERSVQTLNYIAQSSLLDFENRNLNNLNVLTRNILEGEEDICRVQVKMKDGTILIDKIKPKVGERGQVLSVTRPITGNSGEIAKISIYWELDRRLSAINKNAWLMVGYSFLAFFLAISLFLFVTSSLILRPVRRIENQLKAVSNGTDYQPLNLSQFYGLELQHFGAAVDELHQRIIEQAGKEEKLLKATIETQDVKHQLVQAIEAVSEGFVYYDADDKLAICNEKYREIYSESADLLVEGNTFEQIIRKGAERGQYGDDNEKLEEWILERLEQHRNPSGPIEQKLRNGKWVRIVETRSEDGGLVGIRSDITEFKKHQKELKEAKETAEQANDTKSQFLAMMSHEIRTPLNAVLGILGFLNDAKLDTEQKKFVQIGLESASNLSTIINDILDFSKLEVGKVELEITAFDPSQAFNSIIDLLEPGAFAKGITLSLEKNLTPNMFLLGDASRLRQILLNLVGNAIKFTQEGDVKVKISTTADANADDNINLLFEIQDSGIGIALDKQDLLFGQFVTIEASYTRKFGGTGLGLSICKGFADLMNGNIGVESEEGKGSRFWFEIPLKQAMETALLEPDGQEDIGETMIAENSRILLVEDNRANQLVARLILEKIGCKVDIAGNGIEAVDAVTHLPYDLILMDISMPEMDGIAATKKIRQLPTKAARTPIIAMTAHALKEEKEEFLASGMDDYLQKPARADSIHKIVHKWLSKTSRPAPAQKREDPIGQIIEEKLLIELSNETGKEIFPELVQCFLDDTAARKIGLLDAYTKQNDSELKAQVHSLGSSAATFGAIQLHNLCRNIENQLRDKNVEAAYISAQDLETTIDDSLHEIGKYIDGSAEN